MAQSTIETRLCPSCANSIALDTLSCPYCRATVSPADRGLPQWPSSEKEAAPLADAAPERRGLPLGSKIILVLGLLMFAIGVYLVGGQNEHNDLAPRLTAKNRELEERNAKIKSLQEQLAQSQNEVKANASQLDEFKTKFATIEKSLAATQKQLADSQREVTRMASRPVAAPLPPARPRESTPSAPPRPPVSAPRRAVEPGLYETVRSTSVLEEPLASARVLTRISGGTQITVVRGVGEWLEVRSKHGNPPGFVRADDAMFVGKAN